MAKIISFADFYRDNFFKRFRAFTHIHKQLCPILNSQDEIGWRLDEIENERLQRLKSKIQILHTRASKPETTKNFPDCNRNCKEP